MGKRSSRSYFDGRREYGLAPKNPEKSKKELAGWTAPSVRGMEKLPAIDVIGDNQTQVYLDWFDENDSIPRTIPPIYRDFTIRFTRTFSRPNRHEYIDCVHYSEDLTELDVCHVIDGKKVLTVHSRYIDYEGKTVKAEVHAPTSSKYEQDWLKREGIAAIYTVLAIQAHILYHKPEIVPVYLEEREPLNKPAKQKRKPAERPRNNTLKEKVRKYICLDDTPRNFPVARNYRAIQWSVRGHYRRITRKDGTEYLTYVKPHIASRGNKKIPDIGVTIIAQNHKEQDESAGVTDSKA